MMPFAAGQTRGSGLQEGVITIGLKTGAASVILALLLLLWGLRLPVTGEPNPS